MSEDRDPRRLRPDHQPTPFSAEEIRLGCRAGRTVRMLIEQPGETPIVRVTRFVDVDDEGADRETWTESTDGVRLTEPERARSTWLELQGHASMPTAETTIDEWELEIPAGRFAALRYTRIDAEGVSTFWFARAAPGMPLKFEQVVDGTVVYSATAIEDIPGG